ncbi:MAG: flavin reductase family protein [Acidobacteriota bacterium]|nr:MAG: flavin reductase family protein [Acidobacteriota bacterium]
MRPSGLRERAAEDRRRATRSGKECVLSDGWDHGGEHDGFAGKFRDALARWASGVAIVAVRVPEGISGMTASSFCSVSLDPPLVLVSIANDARVLAGIQATRRFAVSILERRAESVSRLFARKDRPDIAEESYFNGSPDPLIRGALAGLACRLWASYPGGDHQIVVGEVRSIELGEKADPLVYWNREYR